MFGSAPNAKQCVNLLRSTRYSTVDFFGEERFQLFGSTVAVILLYAQSFQVNSALNEQCTTT
jgi:hypothetical protein